MRRLVLLLALLAPPSLRAQLHVAVRVSPVADVIRHCGQADYTRLWQERFLRDAADSAALRDWKALRARYAGSLKIETSGRDAIGRTMEHVDLGDRWRLAGLQAHTWVVVARSSAEASPLIERLGALERDVDGVVPAAHVAAVQPKA